MSTTATTPDLTAQPATNAGLVSSAARRLACLPAQLSGDSLLGKSVLSVFDQGVVSGTSFATSVILGRLCAKEDLGVYYLALSIVFFVRGIQEQLVSAPYMIYCSRKEGTALERFAGSSLAHQCVLLVAASLTLAVLTPLGILPAGLQGVMWLLLAAAPLLLMREFVRQLLFAHLDMRAAIALDVSVAAIQLAGLGLLAGTGRLSLAGTLAVLAISSGLPVVVWLGTKPRRLLVSVRDAISDFLHNWTFARWALASQLLACTAPYVMPWVVALTHGAAQTGMLGACSTLVGLSNMFMMGLCNFLSPKAARAFAAGGLAELQSVLRKTALLFATSLGLVCLVGFTLGEQIAIWVYGPAFAGTGLIIGVLSLSVLANSMGVTAGNGLWAMERPSANFVADLFSLCVVVVATVTLVPLWGPLGAALATLCGTSSDATVRLWILRRTMRELAQPRRAAA
ncbi:MAG: lipopolysaccharide biosynthesis protein [Pirellulaceae bacterium]